MDSIFAMDMRELSFEDLYKIAYDLVLDNNGERLYTDISEKLVHRINSHCNATLQDKLSTPEFLPTLTQLYADYKRAARTITDILMYLNMNIANIRVSHGKTILRRAVDIFYETLVSACKDQLREELLRRITKERDGEQIDRKLMATATMMLSDMKCYDEVLEAPLLKLTQAYYSDLAQKWSKECTVPVYLEHVYQRVNDEAQRVEVYLNAQSGPLIDHILREHMVTKHMDFILENPKQGFVQLVHNDQVQDLTRMYFLFSFSEEHLKKMVSRFEKYIFETGRDYVLDPANLQDPISFVDGILDQKKTYDVLCEKSFSNNQLFRDSLDTGFSHFADGNLQKRIAEFLSIYLDFAMRNKTQDPDFLPSLDRALSVFHYLNDKDVFENYYKIHLSKRLLLSRSIAGTSASNDSELLFITKLKEKCGYSFVAKIEGMFNDMRLSKKSYEKFLEHRAYKERVQPLNIDLFVNVLTSSFWPTYTMSRAILPTPMKECTKAFTEYYKEIHESRQLTWKKNLGDGVMIARFPLSKHELVVSTYQMILLMLFNDVNELTYQEIKDTTNMPEKDLRRNLMMLFLGKHKLLAKEPKTKSIKTNDVFKWNAQFKSSQVSIKMSDQIIKESKDKDEHSKGGNTTGGSISGGTSSSGTRKPSAQDKSTSSANTEGLSKAAQVICDYVKKNSTITYKEVCQHLRESLGDDAPKPLEIKKTVEQLIQKEFIRRDDENRKILHWSF